MFSTKNPGFLRNPQGKIIPAKFILNPNYQDICYTKNQIRWGEGIDPEMSKLNQLLRKRIQKLVF